MSIKELTQKLVEFQNDLLPKDKQVELETPQITASQISDTIKRHTGIVLSQELVDF